MALSFVGSGALAASTTETVAPAIHASSTTGDFMVAVFWAKDDTTNPQSGSFSTPTDWTSTGVSGSSGSVIATANDVGSYKMQIFYKVHDGSESAPSATWSGSADPSAGKVFTFRETNASMAAFVAAEDQTATGTTVSATASLTVAAGDLVLGISTSRSDASTFEFLSSDLATAGITYGTQTWTEETSSLGSDIRIYSAVITANSGTSSGDTTYTATAEASGASETVVALARLRQAAAETGDAEATSQSVTSNSPLSAVGARAKTYFR